MKLQFSCDRRTFMKRAAILGGLAALTGLRRPADAAPGQPEAKAEPAGHGVSADGAREKILRDGATLRGRRDIMGGMCI